MSRTNTPSHGFSARPGTDDPVRSRQARLRRLGAALQRHQKRIVDHWADEYAAAYEGRGYFSDPDFRGFALLEVEGLAARAAEGAIDGLAEFFRERGSWLASAAVPFPEVCRSIHLFEAGVVSALRAEGDDADRVLDLYLALDHLSHERLIMLVEAYFGCREERWAERESALLAEVAQRERTNTRRDRLCGIVGRSESMQRVYELLGMAARGRDAVLLVGETGTGKELAARAIHALSGDPPERFVAVNCAALPRELMESELFGHRRGAFSGAQAEHLGLFQSAHGGTLYLDEVTELAAEAQAKLLRALQERAVRPVGSVSEVPLAVRVVASTNRGLEAALVEGKLRRDLYYRLQQLVIPLPPLRERLDDLPFLAHCFMQRAVEEGLCGARRGFTREALEALSGCPWPGNVRELENAVRLACRVSRRAWLELDDLPELAVRAEPAGHPIAAEAPDEPITQALPVSIHDAERDAIFRALQTTEGNKTRAAEMLGISRKQLYVKLRNYELAGNPS